MNKSLPAILGVLVLILALLGYRTFCSATPPVQVGKLYLVYFEAPRGANLYKIMRKGRGPWCLVKRIDDVNQAEPVLTYWVNFDKAISIHDDPSRVTAAPASPPPASP